jgi:hypothetical protein
MAKREKRSQKSQSEIQLSKKERKTKQNKRLEHQPLTYSDVSFHLVKCEYSSSI